MKRISVMLISLLIALLLAGLCSCKQEFSPENTQETIVDIPEWEKSAYGLQELPDAVLYGTETGVSTALVSGLENPPALNDAKHLIVMVCEGLTSELIESSKAQYGDLILESLPVKGTTTSKFSSADGIPLVGLLINSPILKTMTGIVAWGDVSNNSLRRITTTKDNDASKESVYSDQFILKYSNSRLAFVMGKGGFDDVFSPGSPEYLNEVYKSSGKKVSTLEEAVELFNKDDVHFDGGGHYQHDGPVKMLYTIFDSDRTLPSFRVETAFSLAWMQSIENNYGFCDILSYCPSSALDAKGVRQFDDAVAVAVKFVLENPDSALLICGCPVDGSEKEVCFYGLGKDVTVQSTFYDCVSSLY